MTILVTSFATEAEKYGHAQVSPYAKFNCLQKWRSSSLAWAFVSSSATPYQTPFQQPIRWANSYVEANLQTIYWLINDRIPALEALMAILMKFLFWRFHVCSTFALALKSWHWWFDKHNGCVFMQKKPDDITRTILYLSQLLSNAECTNEAFNVNFYVVAWAVLLLQPHLKVLVVPSGQIKTLQANFEFWRIQVAR